MPDTVTHRRDGLVRRPDRVCEKRVVDERRGIPVAPFRMLGRSRRIFDDCYLESLLDQLAQVRFDTHVRQHSAKNDFADPAFAQL